MILFKHTGLYTVKLKTIQVDIEVRTDMDGIHRLCPSFQGKGKTDVSHMRFEQGQYKVPTRFNLTRRLLLSVLSFPFFRFMFLPV